MKDVYLQEAFKALDMLNEEDFSLDSNKELDDAKNFINSDNDIDTVDIIDPDLSVDEDEEDDAHNPEDYVGKVILDCCTCHSKIYKDKEDIHIDEETGLANTDEECPFCYSVDGYTLIGEVTPYEEKDEEIEIEDSEEIEEGLSGTLLGGAGGATLGGAALGPLGAIGGAALGGLAGNILTKNEELNEDADISEYQKWVDFDMEKYGKISRLTMAKIKKAGFSVVKDQYGDYEVIADRKDESVEEEKCEDCDKKKIKEHFETEIEEESLKENLNKSLKIGKLRSLIKRLNEAEMSDEDKADSALLRSIYNKTQQRANAKLTPEETAVLDKYNLRRDSGTKNIRKNTSENPWGDALISRHVRDKFDRWNQDETKINLADRARKMDSRGPGYSATQDYYYDSVSDDHRGWKDPETGFWQRLKDKGLLDQERKHQDSVMQEPVRQMKDAIRDRKYHGKNVADNNAMYDAARDKIQREYEKKLADNEQSRKWSGEYHQNQLDRANQRINKLLKRDKTDEALLDNKSNGYKKYGKYFDKNGELIPEFEEEYLSVTKNESLANKRNIKEHFEKVEIETDKEKMNMTSDEDGKVTVTTEPKEDDVKISPVSDETQSEINPVSNDEDDYEDIDIDDFSEEEFNELGESYLKNVYENVNSFKVNNVSQGQNKLVIEGIIGFSSGKKKKTSFVFEAKNIDKKNKVKFIGENLQMSRGAKSFTLCGKVSNGKFISESLNYNYRTKDSTGKSNRVYGTVKTNKR